MEGRQAICTAVTAIHDPHEPHSLLAGDLNGQPWIGLCFGVAQIRFLVIDAERGGIGAATTGGAHAGTQTWDCWHAGQGRGRRLALAFNACHPVEAEENNQPNPPLSMSRLRPSSRTPTYSLRPVSHRARTQCSTQSHEPNDEASHRKDYHREQASESIHLALESGGLPSSSCRVGMRVSGGALGRRQRARRGRRGVRQRRRWRRPRWRGCGRRRQRRRGRRGRRGRAGRDAARSGRHARRR